MKRLEVPIRYIITTVILLIGGNLAAQSNQLIDTVLAQDHITYGNAATLLATAATPTGNDGTNSTTTFDYPDDHPLTLGEFSLMVMQTFDIPGGIAYSALASPRYAARELAFRNIVQGHSYPRMAVSGERAMRIIGRVLALEEEGTLR